MSFGKAVDLLRLAMMATARSGICLSDIELEFTCVRRTAQRMVQALQEAFPATEHFVGDDNRHYWRLPARAVASLLSPSVEELVAISAGVTELERSGQSMEATNLRRLDRKVRALVPNESSARLATDEEAILEAMGYAARPGPRPAFNVAVDAAISESLKGPFRLDIDYQSRSDATSVWRKVEPIGLLLGARRYLVALDYMKNDGRFRHYRVEDIRDARVLSETFEYPANFRLHDYASRAFGSYHNELEYDEVIWRFAPEAAPRAARFQFHPHQEAVWQSDGSLVVRFKASGYLEMSWHLYAWGEAVEVLSPTTLQKMVHPYRRTDFPSLP